MVVRPDGTTTNVLVGDTWGPAQVGADGTVYQTFLSGNSTKMFVVRPDGTTNTSASIMATPNGRVRVGADGTAYQTTFTGTPPAVTSRR